ncbi:thioredoxin family protein [Niameybacter sp.]|uniref:thioredoxin family protein n=1 Tax=Niameybacter sp. TaxID=2033640 RepID=UPI002FC67EBE
MKDMKSMQSTKRNYEQELLHASEKSDVKVCKINIEEEPELAERFKISSIPTLMFVKEGKVIERSEGVKPKKMILALLEK